jgi:hypothetical protein
MFRKAPRADQVCGTVCRVGFEAVRRLRLGERLLGEALYSMVANRHDRDADVKEYVRTDLEES